MNISKKIIALAILPVLILTLWFGYVGDNLYSNYQDLNKLQKSTEIFSQGNNLVHFLQQERGASAGFQVGICSVLSRLFPLIGVAARLIPSRGIL